MKTWYHETYEGNPYSCRTQLSVLVPISSLSDKTSGGAFKNSEVGVKFKMATMKIISYDL